MTNELAELVPSTQRRVKDLVEAAGLDVSDWANFAGGASKAASNPKYCYEWAFLQPARAVVVNLWHRDMRQDPTGISVTIQLKNRPEFRGVRKARIDKLHNALLHAQMNELPLRVIVNAGTMVEHESEEAPSSRVTARLLDVLPWHISLYEEMTGTWTLKRGPGRNGSVDQFETETTAAPQQQQLLATTFVRSAQVRKTVLERAGGRCEYCGAKGFVMLDGRVFLETHHVVPLSEQGPDVVSNVAALCANHHREAHLGADGALIRTTLLDRLQG